MPPTSKLRNPSTDASGPVVAWCEGHRCAGLRRLHQDDDATERLRSTVSKTRGAVLISSPCLGTCQLASVAAVGHRDGPSGQVGPMVWLSGLDDETRFLAFREWVGAGGPQSLLHPDRLLPSALRRAACGFGTPPVIRHP